MGNANLQTILDISFTTLQEISAAGRKEEVGGGKRASDGRGMIQIVFDSLEGWGTDLGTGVTDGGEVSCKAIHGIIGCIIYFFDYFCFDFYLKK